ncbi:MAG: 3'-5' exonuclease [Paludibacteraceae bacterium]|nr:3'-5' exonuclease [Paludibacteraceae bacterium]MCR4619726.1 3'-5' exonuclease [Paludibacteraceae bacterium]
MKLNLQRPLVFFDLETTGVDFLNDRIVELSFIKILPDGSEQRDCMRINPERPIPPEATAVHHITDEDVASCPTFKQLAPQLAEVFTGVDLAGYNSNKFDVPMLDEEFHRAGVNPHLENAKLIDAQAIFMKHEPRTLVAAHRFYCDGADFDNAHSALADTQATYDVLLAQIQRYDDLSNDIETLASHSRYNDNVDFAGRFLFDKNKKVIVNFGKHKGKFLARVFDEDPSYYSWMMNGDFAHNTKAVLEHYHGLYLLAKKNS